jgi:hypothetical protein
MLKALTIRWRLHYDKRDRLDPAKDRAYTLGIPGLAALPLSRIMGHYL